MAQSELIDTATAAAELGVTIRRVQQLIGSGLLPAQKIGRDYIIQRGDLASVPKDRKPGPKSKGKT